ncbi:MAG: hypothetical protein WAM71_19230 [Candidatus Korobacteraceae bacterium]
MVSIYLGLQPEAKREDMDCGKLQLSFRDELYGTRTLFHVDSSRQSAAMSQVEAQFQHLPKSEEILPSAPLRNGITGRVQWVAVSELDFTHAKEMNVCAIPSEDVIESGTELTHCTVSHVCQDAGRARVELLREVPNGI